MLIKDFDGSTLAKYNKASRMLESLYGIKLSKSSNLSKLHEGLEQANGMISKLKTKNKAINDHDVLKYTLISEALQDLINYENKSRIDELDAGYCNSSSYKQIISWLGDYCNKCMGIGDSIDDSVYDAMKQYRSSKYRYPDTQVESDLYEYLMASMEDAYPAKSSLLDSMSADTINEMIAQMEAECDSGAITESPSAELIEVAKAIVEGDFYGTDTEDGNPVGREQREKAKRYLDMLGGSTLSLADDPKDDSKNDSKSSHHPRRNFG